MTLYFFFQIYKKHFILKGNFVIICSLKKLSIQILEKF